VGQCLVGLNSRSILYQQLNGNPLVEDTKGRSGNSQPSNDTRLASNNTGLRLLTLRHCTQRRNIEIRAVFLQRASNEV